MTNDSRKHAPDRRFVHNGREVIETEDGPKRGSGQDDD